MKVSLKVVEHMRKERIEVNKGLRVKQGLGQGTSKEKNVVRGLAKTKCVGKKKLMKPTHFTAAVA